MNPKNATPATSPAAKPSTPATDTTAKKSYTSDEWNKLTLTQKQAAQQAGDNLSTEQLDDIETETEVAYHKTMLKEQTGKRMPRVLAAIESVGNLAVHNPNDAQKKHILDALHSAVKKVEDRFSGTAAGGFQLPD